MYEHDGSNRGFRHAGRRMIRDYLTIHPGGTRDGFQDWVDRFGFDYHTSRLVSCSNQVWGANRRFALQLPEDPGLKA